MRRFLYCLVNAPAVLFKDWMTRTVRHSRRKREDTDWLLPSAGAKCIPISSVHVAALETV